MRIRDLIKFSADFMAPGAALAPTVRHQAVRKERFRPEVKRKKMAADASASDLASHHTWKEPSASDQTILNWRAKRIIEKLKGRNLEPFEMVRAEATGPCGCTLKLGEKVTVEGIGRGQIKERNERMLRVKLENGKYRTVDQKFVHRLQGAGTSEGALKGWDARGRGQKAVKVAMKHGYSQYHAFKDAGDTFKVLSHDTAGHKLYISNDGSWQHRKGKADYSDADYRSAGYKTSEINRIRTEENRVPDDRSGSSPKDLDGFLKALYK